MNKFLSQALGAAYWYFADLVAEVKADLGGRSPLAVAGGGGLLTGGGAPSWSVGQYLGVYGEVGWLYACVSRIAQAVSETNWHLYALDAKGERRELFKHPALELLDFVNPFWTGRELIERSQQHMELVGESYWLLLRPEGRPTAKPVEIWELNPAQITVVPDPQQYIAGYVYQVGGERIPLSREEVIAFQVPDPRNPYRGLGPVPSLMADLEGEKFAAWWNRAFFRNNAEPGGIIETDNSFTSEQYDEFTARWRQAHGGIANAHRVAMLEKGMHWVDRKVTQRDMQFRDLRAVNRDTILGAFGMPKSILGITEDVNRANAEAAEYTFARWVLRPRLTRIREKLNEQFLPIYGENLQLDYDDPVPENVEQKLRAAVEGFKAGLLQRDEARGILGFDPVASGDVFYMPLAVLPEVVGRPFVLPERPEPQRSLATATRADIRISNPTDIEPRITYTEQESKALDVWLKGVTRREGRMAEWFRAFFRRQEADVLARLRALKAMVKQSADQLWDDDLWDQEVRDSEPLIYEAYVGFGQQMAATIGSSFDLDNPRIRDWLGQHMDKLSPQVNGATKAALTEQLRLGHEAGEGMPQLAKRIRGVFDNADKVRAMRIARTEVVGAGNQGNMEAFRQSGVVERKRWLTVQDGDPRHPSYPGLHGQVRPLDEPFDVGGYPADAPGQVGVASEDINCRCVVQPVI